MEKPLIQITSQGKWSYKVKIGDHEVAIAEDVGADVAAPSPVELFAVSYGGCHALIAEAFLRKHGLSDKAVSVSIDFETSQAPRRISDIKMHISLPVELPEELMQRLVKQLEHCTVRGTLVNRPTVEVSIAVAGEAGELVSYVDYLTDGGGPAGPTHG